MIIMIQCLVEQDYKRDLMIVSTMILRGICRHHLMVFGFRNYKSINVMFNGILYGIDSVSFDFLLLPKFGVYFPSKGFWFVGIDRL